MIAASDIFNFIHKHKFCAGYVLPFLLFHFQPELKIRLCLLFVIWSPTSVGGNQESLWLFIVSFMAPHCWLWFFLLIVIVDPDCLVLIVGARWWEERKPARCDRRATTTTALRGVSGKVVQNFLLSDQCPVRAVRHSFWKIYDVLWSTVAETSTEWKSMSGTERPNKLVEPTQGGNF